MGSMGVDDMMRWVTQLSLTALKTEFVCKFAKKRELKQADVIWMEKWLRNDANF